jgi:hypothetical protein
MVDAGILEVILRSVVTNIGVVGSRNRSYSTIGTGVEKVSCLDAFAIVAVSGTPQTTAIGMRFASQLQAKAMPSRIRVGRCR